MHSTYHAYLIKVSNIKYYEFEITIKGKPGELVKIGTLPCSGQNCKIDYFYNGVEYFGLLIKGFQYMNCFPEDILHNKNYQFKAYDDFHKEIKYIVYQSCSTNPSTGKLECKPDACIEIPSNFNEIFYYIKSYNPISNNGIIDENSFNLYPLEYGLNYSISLRKGETIRFFPLYFTNFDYLTYNIKSEQINNISIFNCDNYPACILSPNKNSKNIPIQRAYGSYSFSFNKNDISNWSPIGKNQKLLMITCYQSSNIFNTCFNLVRIYTDKSFLYLKSSQNNEYMMIRKGNIDNLAIYDLAYVSIETLSGQISIDFDNNTTNHYSKNNIHGYIIKKDSEQKFLILKIKGEKNSVYSIKTHNERIINTKNIGILNEISFSYGGNSLFRLEQNETVESFILSFKIDYKSYFSLYPIGCEIDIKNATKSLSNYTLTSLNLEHGLYQDIIFKSYRDIWIKSKEKNTTCFIFSSFFILEKNTLYDDGIILEDNSPQTFLFNENYSEFEYIYYIVNNDDKININFKLLDKSKYKMILFINDNELVDSYNIEENKKIELKNNKWENMNINAQQICKISFNVLLESSENEKSFIEISINSEENKSEKKSEKNSNKSKDNKKSKKIIFFIIIGALILFLIILFIFIFNIYRNKNKNPKNDLENEINNLYSEKDAKFF